MAESEDPIIVRYERCESFPGRPGLLICFYAPPSTTLVHQSVAGGEVHAFPAPNEIKAVEDALKKGLDGFVYGSVDIRNIRRIRDQESRLKKIIEGVGETIFATNRANQLKSKVEGEMRSLITGTAILK